jgi:hypothetical protein
MRTDCCVYVPCCAVSQTKDLMEEMGHVFNAWTFTAAVPAMVGQWQRALQFMDLLLSQGVHPNESMINELFKVLWDAGQRELAARVFAQAIKAGLYKQTSDEGMVKVSGLRFESSLRLSWRPSDAPRIYHTRRIQSTLEEPLWRLITYARISPVLTAA